MLCLATADAFPAVVVSVSPTTATLIHGQSQQFTATVSGTKSPVIWSIDPTIGTISASGLYTAPSSIFSGTPSTITVTATTADGSGHDTATVTLQPTVAVKITPTAATLTANQAQQFDATVTGTQNQAVNWNINPQIGTIDNTGLYTAPASITAKTSVQVVAESVADPTESATATITLNVSGAISVTVSPPTASLSNGQQQQFKAAVANATNTAVTWSINPQVGTMDPNAGLYSAPALISGTQTITVTATSQQDPSKTGTAKITLATVTDVGTGAPTPAMQESFFQAFSRNGFNGLVSLPPVGNVKRLGTTGYVQEFYSLANSSQKYALATVSATVTDPSIQVVQIYSLLYAYYTSVGAGTAGLPLMDTQVCPQFTTAGAANTCQYDFFDKNYALFAYANPLATGSNFSISGAFYTEWTNLGAMSGGPGQPIDTTSTITASTATTATTQPYAYGVIYTLTSGANKNKTVGVIEPLYDLYTSQGGPLGSLGLPTGDAVTLASGMVQQQFEGGKLEYTSGGGPVVVSPVDSIAWSGASPGATIKLNLGQTLTVTATPYSAQGAALTDRVVSWSSTNSSVISIQSSGQSAVLTAVGGGGASVTASSGGVSSAKLSFVVIAPCCAVGDGAPVSVQQAFRSALTRDQIVPQVPVATPAERVGEGYVQMVQSSGPNPVVYMLAESDSLGTAFVLSGAILAQYQSLGGPAGTLGYPTSDATPGGTQLFQNNAALAGSPVRLVGGPILTKWALLKYETGIAGAPISDASEFSTFGANSGLDQSFVNGMIFGATAGPRSGQAYFVSGLILARYNALGGVSGDFGMPVSDEFVTGALHQQNFEGGSITYSAGDAAAVANPAPKVPGVIVAPSSIAAGGRVTLAIVGFPNGATIRVSITGQPDFVVTSPNGAYSWNMAVPLTAASGTLAIQASDTNGPSTASGTLTIAGFADHRVQLSKVQGDNQTGVPGALLPIALKVALVDASGAPVVGAPVTFQATAGATLSVTSTVTDGSGQAQTSVRLPGALGVTAVNASSPGIAQTPVTFYAQAAASTFQGFPQLSQAGSTPLGNGPATIGQKGALLTAVASILRYRQNRGELPAPNGIADPVTLDQFLQAFCTADARGNQLCDGFLSNPASGEQIVNLWRAAAFTGGVDVVVQAPTTAAIADLLAQGYPALVSLGLSFNGTLVGGHFVVATGVAADGSIVIQDPNPFFARSNLSDYLNGFTAQSGGVWKADLRGVVQFALRSPSATRFMLAALSQPPALVNSMGLSIQSTAGSCGTPLDLLDSVDSAGTPPAAGALVSRIDVCDGLQSVYQVSVGTAQPYKAFVTDLASGGDSTDVSGSAPATYRASRPQLALALVPQTVSFTANAVVNAATFTGGIAPGGIMAIFGTGLSNAGTNTTVSVDGVAAPVISASPFQVNAQVPPGTAPGVHTVTVSSAYGTAQQTVNVVAVAPAVFLVGNNAGAVLNQDYSLNSPSNPLPRGQTLLIYATGLGAVSQQGGLAVVTTSVSVVVNGQELPAAFAGLAPGFIGLYQVNVVIPTTTPPGLGISLTLKQGGVLSNTVGVSLQ